MSYSSRMVAAALLCIGIVICASARADVREADVVVYGDASGGVTAAVQAARMGKSVILVSQYGHLGGMTSSGLGWTDIGNERILGGLSREFYHLLYRHYQKPEAWTQESRDTFANKGQGVPALNPMTELASTFEPKVAEAVFDAMVKDAGVKVIEGRLDLKRGVVKSGKRIAAIRLEDGTIIKGKMFIDASYEGDLLPLAGVSFVVGRESNAKFNEQGNGNTGAARKNQLPNDIDPYIVKGDPSSGLLPGVNPNAGGKKGDGDHRLQAYCYRMVLTDVPSNRLPISKPDGYDEADYEILFRAIEAGQRGGFFKTSPMPNRKTDSNNTGGISTDYIGMNNGKDWSWATLNHEQRESLAAKHRDWQLGLVWTIQNHPRVPQPIRDGYAKWGLPKDEFTDNGHWPHNLYVREARRMRSDFVMTENHCKRKLPVEDPIGMGAYTLDSHNTQRFVHNGMVKNEGDIQSYLGGKAYGIAYRGIVPSGDECENLLVPWALSATHIAFGSIRMEPVFMILGQSAATAACIAIDDNTSIQAVPYDRLRARLLNDGQKVAVQARPVLQIINGSEQTVQVYWLKSERERISNGKVAPGEDTFITTTLGHRFAIVGQEDKFEVSATSSVPVQAVRFDPPHKDGVPAFYTQRIRANGFPIVASAKVNPYALKEAAYLVDLMLAKRPDVRQAMIRSGARLCILAHDEFTTDQPEFARLAKRPVKQFLGISPRDYRDARARGMGGSEEDPFCSCAEENLLGYPGDPYAAECILIHELAHNIHLRGMINVDPTFDARLKATYEAAMAAGLWRGKYASVNHHEYFAEGVQSWFDNNRENDHDHNHVNTRKELLEYDPRLAEICREVFGDTKLRYTKPAMRLNGHLQGYDPAKVPTFEWPERLTKARAAIRRAAAQRDQKASQE